MHKNHLPIIPRAILKKHKVDEVADTRFKASARMLQSLWREDREIKIGTHTTPNGRRRKLGSRLHAEAAQAGANFLSTDIAKLAHRELVYREPGALMDEDRLWSNMLSSQPLCFNLFGGLKLDMDKANSFFTQMFPDYVAAVDGIYFEHSPGRGNPAFTEDHTAFDVFVTCTTTDGEEGFIAIEVKYSETMAEPLAVMRPRYDDLSQHSGLYCDPDSQALRTQPVQQLWREHLLSRAMISNGLYGSGRFVVVYPNQNNQCSAALAAYQEHLASDTPSVSGFQAVTLEECVETLRKIGDAETADALYGRYLDFKRVEQAIFG